MEIRKAVVGDLHTLLGIWERSVRATHTFLSEEDIAFFLPLVRDHGLKDHELWVLVAPDSSLMGFMGLSGNRLEALFLAPEYLRLGGGRLLIEYARKLKGPLQAEVNEQNLEALTFYQAMGFIVEGRSDLDSTGRPFPLLHLREASLKSNRDSLTHPKAPGPGGSK